MLAGLRVERRRADWRLGRWTAKAAVGAWLEVPPARVQILGAPDGAPEALLDGARVPLSVSISHRGGRALAAVIAAPCLVGCDLEVIEARSAAFIREWFAASEQRLMADCAPAERALSGQPDLDGEGGGRQGSPRGPAPRCPPGGRAHERRRWARHGRLEGGAHRLVRRAVDERLVARRAGLGDDDRWCAGAGLAARTVLGLTRVRSQPSTQRPAQSRRESAPRRPRALRPRSSILPWPCRRALDTRGGPAAAPVRAGASAGRCGWLNKSASVPSSPLEIVAEHAPGSIAPLRYFGHPEGETNPAPE